MTLFETRKEVTDMKVKTRIQAGGAIRYACA
jgi:hypothetical protein